MRSNLFISIIFIILMMFLWSCENAQLPVEQTSSPDITQLNKLALPNGATVTSAILYLYVKDGNASPLQTVNIHRVTEEWSELDVTWTNRLASTNWTTAGGEFDPVVEGSFVPAAVGWLSADITALVNKWINDPISYPNYGMLLKQDNLAATSRYYGRESIVYMPYVELTYNGTTVQISGEDLPDAFIRSDQTEPLGDRDWMAIGNTSESPKKRALLKFDIETIPDDNDGGCTLTPGYWKTHSSYGPAPFDETWKKIIPNGDDQYFFTSGQTYYEVLWTEPKGGNAYYILAHAYIAAELNKMKGAKFTDAQAAFSEAMGLLATYTPDQVGSWRGGKHPMKEIRDLFISLADILDDYNNGEIGPGHCE